MKAERLRTTDELAKLEERWEAERAIVAEIDAARGRIETIASGDSTGGGDGSNNAGG